MFSTHTRFEQRAYLNNAIESLGSHPLRKKVLFFSFFENILIFILFFFFKKKWRKNANFKEKK